jgi:uncharacterized protein YndB with AHSA1/START domain
MATTVLEMDKQSESGESLKLEMKRVIRASRQRVFDAWTRPETIRLWFGPGRELGEVLADAKVGGEYSFTMLTKLAGDAGAADRCDVVQTSSAKGRYVRVEPYDLLQFTWIGSWDASVESMVTLTFTDVEGGTELAFVQQRFSSEASRDQHEYGWAPALDKLKQVLESA